MFQGHKHLPLGKSIGDRLALIEHHAFLVMRDLRPLIDDASHVNVHIRSAIEGFLDRHPQVGGSRLEVAHHEAGHLAAYEATGMLAGMAQVHGRANDWGGEASALDDRKPSSVWFCSANDFLNEALVQVAGPIAEGFAGGDMLSSSSEILKAGLLATRAADMMGEDRHQMRLLNFLQAAKIIDIYKPEITKIVEVLERSKVCKIGRTEKIFSQVRGYSLPYVASKRRLQFQRREVDRLMVQFAAAMENIDGLVDEISWTNCRRQEAHHG